ncbi:exodeoxyribonuclease III [Deltaproteobacteria bacterium]|nr:exodeoxyribonuclease III [Deltaproteobacteria bacterium]
MNITTFNVNSIRARLDRLLGWLDDRVPDVVCLQELKCTDADVPRAELEKRGYHVATYGQKTYNGVAILSRTPITDVETDLPWAGDSQARGIAGTVAGVRIVNLYVVNGQDTASDKYPYKLEWLQHLRRYLDGRTAEPLLVCGDFNIAPADADVYDPASWKGQVLCTDAEREAFSALLALGLTDSFRKVNPDRRQFTWWDYRSSGFEQNKGVRIDHHLVSATLLPRVLDVTVDMEERGRPQASDHAPVTLHLV